MTAVEIVSFGYLHGEPPQAHITLDLRNHFRDPHINPALREMTAATPSPSSTATCTSPSSTANPPRSLMSASRHFFKPGTLSDTELKSDIKADVAAARGAQRDLKAAGQRGAAERMGAAVDEHLDELNAANNGTWHPEHA